MYRERKKLEFLRLTQGDMSVAEYEVQFLRLARYAPDEIATDELKRKRFERGLRLEIREKIIINPPSYNMLTEMALKAEEIINERNASEAKRRKTTRVDIPGTANRTGDSYSHREFRQWKPDFHEGTRESFSEMANKNSNYRTSSDVRPGRIPELNEQVTVPCVQCGRKHSGECWGKETKVCYGCGQLGHVARNCPIIHVCFNCGQTGHFARNCPEGKGEPSVQREPNDVGSNTRPIGEKRGKRKGRRGAQF